MVYHGSNLFAAISSLIGVQIHVFNFLISQVISILIGVLYRYFLVPSENNVIKRHFISFLIGIFLNYFCFGIEIIHLIIQTLVTYLIIISLPRSLVQYFVFFFAMGYLAAIHFKSQIFERDEYTLDITMPMMITTQKLISFGFSYNDGSSPVESLTINQKSQMIKKEPSLLEMLSYIFNFQGTICGPLCSFIDYIDYVSGDNFKKYKLNNQPSILKVLFNKIIGVIILSILYFNLTIKIKTKDNMSNEIMNASIMYRLYYLLVSTSLQRIKFYVAWVLADAVNNASGLGFNGFDENGDYKWDLVSNINILNLETSTSVKSFIDNWNIQTQLWLRRIAFDRLPKGKTLGVFVLSAFWHGFHPGYYLTFLTLALLVYAGRGIRRNIKPLFQSSKFTKLIYAVITWIGTLMSISFAVVPYELYTFWDGVQFFNSWYWLPHIICLIIIFTFPCQSSSSKKKD